MGFKSFFTKWVRANETELAIEQQQREHAASEARVRRAQQQRLAQRSTPRPATVSRSDREYIARRSAELRAARGSGRTTSTEFVDFASPMLLSTPAPAPDFSAPAPCDPSPPSFDSSPSIDCSIS